MHAESMREMKKFIYAYYSKGESVLDIGSRRYKGQEMYNSLLPKDADYTGLDISNGENVDIIVADPYHWVELDGKLFDIILCGQVFEHSEFFWKLFTELYAHLKVGGCACIIAPSKGHIHRYPVDCWRINKDGMRALGKHMGLKCLSVYQIRDFWDDVIGIFRK